MIRCARPADVPAIHRFIFELAEYEKLAHECRADASRLCEHLFGARPVCEALIAEDAGGQAVGFALFFAAYSTFEANPCLWLEDLYVSPAARGQGHGKSLLRTLAAIARARGWPRVSWNVLAWNTPAIDFYRGLGATLLCDWRVCRVEGDAIAQLAGDARVPG
jgi:GNAT superfamily N-acetyltransferase